jgi:hypothetical protein
MPKAHAAADLFPLLEGQEFIDLVEDIRSRGLIEPVWMYGDVLLDGRNRWRACNEAGVEVGTTRRGRRGGAERPEDPPSIATRRVTLGQEEERTRLVAGEAQGGREAGRLPCR